MVTQRTRTALCTTGCADFAKEPIFDPGVDPSVAAIQRRWQAAPIRASWNRSTDRWCRSIGRASARQSGHADTVLKSCAVHADREANDLVAYTNKDTWVFPVAAWDNKDANTLQGLTYNVFDEEDI